MTEQADEQGSTPVTVRLSPEEQDRLRTTLVLSHPSAVWINVRAAVEHIIRERMASVWDEAVQALAWAQDNGPDPLRYVAGTHLVPQATAGVEERYPSMGLVIEEMAQGDPEAQDRPNVPPGLINDLQRAHHEVEKAEHAILVHLKTTGQFERTISNFDRRLPQNEQPPIEYVLQHNLRESTIDNWLDRLDENLGQPTSNWRDE